MSTRDIELPEPKYPGTKAELAEIKVVTDGGPWCTHNMPCAVFGDKHAVLDMSMGIFRPSWQAQKAGWKLIRVETRLQKWILRLFFKERK